MKSKAIIFLLLSIPAFAQWTIQGSGSGSGLGSGGSIVVVNTPHIQCGSYPAGTQAVAYSQPCTATGGTLPYVWSISNGALPAGLTLNASTGTIAGTPTATGTSTFTLMVTDNAAFTDSSAKSILINPSNALTLQAKTLPQTRQNAVYPPTLLIATGGVTPYASCSFPVPLSVPTGLVVTVVNGTSSGCQLSGTITAPPNSGYGFPVQITDHVGTTASTGYSITVLAVGSGPPTAYTRARVDMCETVGDPGCTGGAAVPMIFDGTAATMAQVPVLWETSTTASCPSPPCHRVGLNKTGFDPDFGAFLIRASDKFGPCEGGSFGIKGADGGDVPWIGLTDTTLAVPSAMFLTASSGSKTCLSYYKPSTHTVVYSQIQGGGGNNGTTTLFATGAAVAMSGAQPKHMFELISLKTKDVINDLTIDNNPASGTFDTITSRIQVFDLINGGPDCLPSSYASLASSPWTGTFNISKDDNKFTIGFSGTGGQGTGFEAVRVDRSKTGCRYFVFSGANTGVQGDWGCHYTPGAGMATCTADTPGVTYPFVTDNPDICGAQAGNPAIPCTIDDQFLLHGVQQTPDPAWFTTGVNNSACTTGHTCSCFNNKVGSVGGCGEYFFNGDTNLVEPCILNVCSGHVASGLAYQYKQPGGGTSPLRRISRARPTVGSNANPGTAMTPSLPSDYHGSYENADATDSTPLSLAMADVLHTNTQGMGWTNRPAYPSALYGEIISCSALSLGTCYRFNHSFNSTLEMAFAPVENIFIMSPEGTWGYMMSDWMGNFGSYAGADTCNMVGGDSYNSGHTYALNDEITALPPVAHGANGHNASFKATTGGTAASAMPAAMNGVAFKVGTYALNTYIIPATNGGSTSHNTSLNIFQVTTAGTSGTEPNWDSSCSTTCSGAGGTAVYTKVTQPIADGPDTLKWTFEGRNDCSGDAVIIDLTPLI